MTAATSLVSSAPAGRVAVPDGEQARNARRMRHLVYGHLRSRAVCAMAELGLADLLGDDRLTATELARLSDADPALLARLLRALAVFGVLREEGAGQFALTPLGATLRGDAPGSALATALLASAAVAPAWQQLPEVVRSGRPAFAAEFGREFFAHLESDPELRSLFDRSQETGLALELESVVGAVDLSGPHTLVDVGGGDAAMLTGLLDAFPQLSGILVDLASALPAARRRLAATGLADRCVLVEGDFFGVLPSGADSYLLRHILHDWDDNSCRELLRSCHRAMDPGSRLLVVEHLVAPADALSGADASDAQSGALMDLYMMSLFGGGQERGRAEFEGLLRDAGFTVTGVTRLPGGSAVVEARQTGGEPC